MSRRKLTSSESRAWARVARSVRPIAGAASAPAPITRSAPREHPAAEPAIAPARGKGPGPVAKAISGAVANREQERRVRRGQVRFDAHFDMHGLTQSAADTALPAFLSRQRAMGARCVLVITGKGKDGSGVLRRNFLHWLQQAPARALVSGIAPAHTRHGGAGAFYVFLRKTGG